MSGPFSDSTGQGSLAATRMAIKDFGGKLLDRPINLLFADHQNKPDIAAGIATEWFDTRGVTAILDVTNSSAALAVMNTAEKRDRIVMLPGVAAIAIVDQNCIKTAVDYTYNTYALAQTVGRAVLKDGGKSWYFIAADDTFGHELRSEAGDLVQASGGKVVGTSYSPIGNADYSSELISAQTSGADVIALALASGDVTNALKQAAEFGVFQGKQKIALLNAQINDIEGAGLQTAQNVLVADAFYWDLNDRTRAWSKRFFDELHRMPNMNQAGAYSSTMHYLNAVQKAGTTEAGAVMRAMRETPINDFFATNGHIRADGLMVHDMFLFRVKSPAESKGPWDDYQLVTTVPGQDVALPVSQSKCPLLK